MPPTETSFTRYLPRIPSETDVLYHVMVGPSVLTFVKELGDFYGTGAHPQFFGFIDSLEAISTQSPGLEFLEGSHFCEGMPRYRQPDSTEFDAFYRKALGVDDSAAAIGDPKDVSTYSHMFSCWETLFVIKAAMEAASYKGIEDRQALVEAIEAMTAFAASNEHPQGDKTFNGKTHQVFGHQFISKVADGKLDVVHRTSIEDGLYPDQVDYQAAAFHGAHSAAPTKGLEKGRTEDLSFKADKAGSYLCYCGVPGHGNAGMWIRFQVADGAKAPAVTIAADQLRPLDLRVKTKSRDFQ